MDSMKEEGINLGSDEVTAESLLSDEAGVEDVSAIVEGVEEKEESEEFLPEEARGEMTTAFRNALQSGPRKSLIL